MAYERIVYTVKIDSNSEYTYMRRLKRILSRQERIYDNALTELNRGFKMNCWMWFIFPGLRALAKSRKSFVFGLEGPHDARGYLAHPILGPRLTECCEMLLTHKDKSVEEILGYTDAKKLHSSMTIFAYVSDNEDSVFHKVLRRFFNGAPEYVTLSLLKKEIILWDFTENGKPIR